MADIDFMPGSSTSGFLGGGKGDDGGDGGGRRPNRKNDVVKGHYAEVYPELSQLLLAIKRSNTGC